MFSGRAIYWTFRYLQQPQPQRRHLGEFAQRDRGVNSELGGPQEAGIWKEKVQMAVEVLAPPALREVSLRLRGQKARESEHGAKLAENGR
jgi:hypothetical protein